MAKADAQLNNDGTGKKVLLLGLVQGDGSTVDVYVQCTAAVDVEGRAVDSYAVLEVLMQINKEMSRMRKAFGDFVDNAELMLDCDDSDEDDGDDDGGES